MNIIKFYRTNEKPYGVFSNFAKYPIIINGKEYPTSEHYFQSCKFDDSNLKEKVRLANTPMEAANIGRDRSLPLNPLWDSIKNDCMYKALYAKFTQYPELKGLLINTGDAIIQEATTNDYYWGIGNDGTGKNMLGVLLMKLRDEFK